MKTNKKVVIKVLLLFTVFFIGIILGLFFWDKIKLPFHNPWGIVGPLTEIKYNPTNDLFRFAVFILFPALLLVATYFLNIERVNDICFGENPQKNDCNFSTNLPSAGKTIFAVILIVFSILVAIDTPTYYSHGIFDTFHEGESLGTSISYINGKVPYKDFLFAHGIFQDPLRSVVAFKLFGKSIGSVRTFESIVKILTFVLIAVFVITIYRGNYLYSSTTLIILVGLIGSSRIIIIPRDITTFSFLITLSWVASSINRHALNIKKFFMLSFIFSFIPLASFGYSIDRGFYLFASYLIISPILYFFFFHRSIFRIHYLISSFLGLLSAILLMCLLLRGNFSEFFKFTFMIMPKYKELTDGIIYPIYKAKYLWICVLMAINTYWVTFRFIQEFHLNKRKVTISIKKFIEKYPMEFFLLLLSIFFFRSALGRSGWGHVCYSSIITYILSIYIFIKYYLHDILHGYGSKKSYSYLFTLTIVLTFGFDVYKIHNKNLICLIYRNFPFEIEDSQFIPNKYKATISFLRNNLTHDEEFLTMTSEASWYYFIDKPCPTRFPVVWFATPYFYQNEIVEDLKKGNVKFILYRNNHWANEIDGFDNEKRLPIIVGYIVQNYVFFKNIEDNEIWIKKSD